MRWVLVRVFRGFAALTAVCSLASAAAAQGYPERMRSDYGEEDPYREDVGPFSLRTGLGFTADPDAFLLGFEGDFRVAEEFSLGAQLQLGVDDDLTLVSPVAYGRYRMNLGVFDPDLDRIEPYLQGGLGFTFWDVDRPKGRKFRRDDDDLEFLLNFGFGVEYRLTEHVSAGSHMLFNIVPNEIFDERFYFSWEVVTLRYRF